VTGARYLQISSEAGTFHFNCDTTPRACGASFAVPIALKPGLNHLTVCDVDVNTCGGTDFTACTTMDRNGNPLVIAAQITPTPAPTDTVTPTPPATMTPTPTACTPVPSPHLDFEFSVDPSDPKVGDQVQLSFAVSGSGGLPTYTLSGAAPIFAGATPPVQVNQLGTVVYHVTAAQAGTATLTLNVNYETAVGCAERPFFEFVSEASPPFTVAVAASAPPCIGDCDGDGTVDVSELITGVNIALGSASIGVCPALDCGCAGGMICLPEINCLIQAVGNALNGCPVAGTAIGPAFERN
jgi:hypothetical protein